MTPEDPVKQQTIQSVGSPRDVVREQDKIQLILAYLFPLSLIPWLTVKDSEYVVWHAKNGTWLGLIGFVVVSILSAITCGIGSFLFIPLLVVQILGIVKALQGERWRIPMISNLADKN